MTKANLLRGQVEEAVRRKLTKRFGQPFHSQKVSLHAKSDGSIATYEVDAVSDDKRIIAAIYSGERRMKGSLLNKLWKDAYFLLLIENVESGIAVEKRLLVFADRQTADRFREKAEGKYDPNIVEIVDVRLPPRLDRERRKLLWNEFPVSAKRLNNKPDDL
jgi:hypothetical protein